MAMSCSLLEPSNAVTELLHCSVLCWKFTAVYWKETTPCLLVQQRLLSHAFWSTKLRQTTYYRGQQIVPIGQQDMQSFAQLFDQASLGKSVQACS